MTRQILLTISYDGTNYCGFQVQPNGVSVEGLLNEALSKIAGHPLTILGASRTDAGVHAEGQRASFCWKDASRRIITAMPSTACSPKISLWLPRKKSRWISIAATMPWGNIIAIPSATRRCLLLLTATIL